MPSRHAKKKNSTCQDGVKPSWHGLLLLDREDVPIELHDRREGTSLSSHRVVPVNKLIKMLVKKK